MIGRRFGRLLVMESYGVSERFGRKNKQWLCLCDCGKTCIVITNTLNTGQKASCGCLKRDMLSSRMKTHGLTGTKLYDHWMHMRQRCSNPKNKKYKDYGGRGITVCKDWEDSFEKFLEDMLPTYEPHLSLERSDVNGNYNKENCEWVSLDSQARNRRMRVDNTSGITGVSRRSTSYVATWIHDGKSKYESFSIKQHGEEQAKQMAIARREKAIKELEEFGIKYGKYHGIKEEAAQLLKEEEQ